MKECSKCGGFLDGGEKRCPICNTRLRNRPSGSVCPQCHGSVSPGEACCQICGTRLGVNAPAATPRYTQNTNSTPHYTQNANPAPRYTQSSAKPAPPQNTGAYIPGYSQPGQPYRQNIPTAQSPSNVGKGIAAFVLLLIAISAFLVIFIAVFNDEYSPVELYEESNMSYNWPEETTYPVEKLVSDAEAQFYYKQGVYEEDYSMEAFRALEPIQWTVQGEAVWDFQSILTPAGYSLQASNEAVGAYAFIQSPCYFSRGQENAYFPAKTQLLPDQYVWQYLESAFPLAGEIDFSPLQEIADTTELQKAWEETLPQEGALAKTADMQFFVYQSTGKLNTHARNSYKQGDMEQKQSYFFADFAYCSFQLELEGEQYSVWGIPYFRLYLLDELLLQTVYLPIIRTMQDNVTLNAQFIQAQREMGELWLDYAKDGRIFMIGHAPGYLKGQVASLPAQYAHDSFFAPDALTKALRQPDCSEYQIAPDWSICVPNTWNYVWADMYDSRFLLAQNSYVTPWDYVDGTEHDWKELVQADTE